MIQKGRGGKGREREESERVIKKGKRRDEGIMAGDLLLYNTHTREGVRF